MNTETKITKKVPLTQSLIINRKNGRIDFSVLLVKFLDKDTKQVVLHLPGIDVTGYGDTMEEAEEILKFSVSEFCKWMVGLKEKDMNYELVRLGWKHEPLLKKNYSKVFVDLDGNLKGFNAEDNTIELMDIEMVG